MDNNNNFNFSNTKFHSDRKRLSSCTNCGRTGHEYKDCKDPITSWGVILVDLGGNYTIKHSLTDFSQYKSNVIPKTVMDIVKISDFMNSIRFLLVQRKHSLGFIEFVRGRYKPDNVDGINFLFQQMTDEEITNIGKSTFDDLWNEMWSHDEFKINLHKKEYIMSKEKFDMLKDNKNVELPLEFYVTNVKPSYKTYEWGFPKGRRNRNESGPDCALREFCEETGINKDDIKIITEIIPIEEKLTGTNGIKYKHIYMIAELKNPILPKIDKENKTQSKEIGDIGFFKYTDALSIIRDYHIEKRSILTMLYMYYIERINEQNIVV